MLEQFSSRAAPGARSNERLRAQAESLIRQTFCDVDLGMPGTRAPFEFAIDRLRLGSLDVLDFRGVGAIEARRHLHHVRADGGTDTWVYLPRVAGYDLLRGGERRAVLPGQFAFVDNARPFVGRVVPGRDARFASLLVRVPSALLHAAVPRVAAHRCQPLSADGASARIALGMIEALLEESPGLDGDAARRLGESLLQALAAAAHDTIATSAPAAARGNRQREVTRQAVVSYVRAHLDDPTLATSQIARACGISLRQLHALFTDQPATVSAWIRNERLDRCRALLRDPAADGLTVTEVALLWGFTDSSHFARRYRHHFGLAPHEERRRT